MTSEGACCPGDGALLTIPPHDRSCRTALRQRCPLAHARLAYQQQIITATVLVVRGGWHVVATVTTQKGVGKTPQFYHRFATDLSNHPQ